MVLDKRMAAINHIRAALSIPLTPIQYFVSWPVQLVDQLRDTVITHDTLVKENLNLKAQQLLLKAQVQRLLAIEIENNQLKSLARSSAQIQGKISIAQLLAVSTDPSKNQVLLDKGSHHHIFLGQAVLDAYGVMGQVVQVSPFTSRVLLINDARSGVPVQIVRNGIRTIAIGDSYTKKLRLLNIPHTADVKVGDVLITSGLGENFPEGYPVGQITSIVRDPGLQFSLITVEPTAHLDRSRIVLLVWPNKPPTDSSVKL